MRGWMAKEREMKVDIPEGLKMDVRLAMMKGREYSLLRMKGLLK